MYTPFVLSLVAGMRMIKALQENLITRVYYRSMGLVFHVARTVSHPHE